jgi:hypothetical protein
MPHANTPIPSVETAEISDLDLGPGSLSQRNDTDLRSYFLNIARDFYDPRATEGQINAFDEQVRRRTYEFGGLTLGSNVTRREFLIGECKKNIRARLDLAAQIYQEMEAYEQAAAMIRTVVAPKYVKALKEKNTNARDWEKARADMHDALIPASKSLQKLEVNIFEGSPGTSLTWTIEPL